MKLKLGKKKKKQEKLVSQKAGLKYIYISIKLVNL